MGADLSGVERAGTPDDLYEDKDNLYLKAELPGMKREDIEVSLHEGTLSIWASARARNNTRTPRCIGPSGSSGGSSGRLSLPTPCRRTRSRPSIRTACLTVTLPKTEEAKPKQIDVHVS